MYGRRSGQQSGHGPGCGAGGGASATRSCGWRSCTHPSRTVPQACLIGAVALALRERDARAKLTVDGGPAIDFVWDAVQQARGLTRPGVAGRAAPPEVRLARMREVAQWNDRPGRSRADVLAVLDLAISRVIIAAMRA